MTETIAPTPTANSDWATAQAAYERLDAELRPQNKRAVFDALAAAGVTILRVPPSMVTACTLALSPIRDTLPEGFSYFVSSIAAPVASGWSGLPGGTCTHWKSAALPRRTPTADIRPEFEVTECLVQQ